MKPQRCLMVVIVLVSLLVGLTAIAGAQDRQTYVVKSGDTLWDISKRFYNDETLWPKLWELNRYQTTNPHQIYVGDVLTIYPLEELLKAEAPASPPPVEKLDYDRGQALDTAFPKYFTFVADPAGIAGSGINRIKVKKIHHQTGKEVVTYDEVMDVGEIVASMEQGKPSDVGLIHGRMLLSYYDDVIVMFNKDVANILNSATHNDPDPYYREFPIYEIADVVPDTTPGSKAELGRLHRFKGILTVVSRVEKLTSSASAAGQTSGFEPVSFVAKITYSPEPISIGDRVFLFKSVE